MLGCKYYKKKNGEIYLYEIHDDRIDLYIGTKFAKRENYVGNYVKVMKEMTDDKKNKKLIDKYCG